jgi:hypothetical protein
MELTPTGTPVVKFASPVNRSSFCFESRRVTKAFSVLSGKQGLIASRFLHETASNNT